MGEYSKNTLNSLEFTSFTKSADFSLDQVKIYSKIESGSFEDDILNMMLDAFILKAQKQSGLSLGNSTIKAVYDKLNESYIKLLYSPLSSVTSIKGFEEDGTVNLLSTDDYTVTTGNSGLIELKSGKSWPNTDKLCAGYEVIYECNMTDIPANIILGVNICMMAWYHDRQRVNPPASAIRLWQDSKVKFF